MAYSKYKAFTLDELQKLINQQIKPCIHPIETLPDPVYDQLFAGLDISLLKLMCIQVKWSLFGHKQDAFVSVLNEYADSIINLIPLWKDLCSKISSEAAYFSYCMKNAFIAYRKNDLEKFNSICSDLKKSLKEFEENNREIISNVNSLQSNLSNFIISKLIPIVSDNTQWTDYGLEKCLSNEKFIDGTKVSLYNSKTIFSFTTNNVSQSIHIICETSGYSSNEIMFTLDGQTQIWNIISETAKKLETSLEEFIFFPPNHSTDYGGNHMYKKNIETNSELQLQTVIDAAQAVVDSNQNMPKYGIAQCMLKLMNGDTSAIKQLPTLNQPLIYNYTSSQSNDCDNQELISATSETSIKSSRGLLGLTKENIIDIKTYVNKSLNLKTTEAEVAQILGYQASDPICQKHPEFTPAKFAEFYKPFHEHASLWNELETDIISQGNSVQTYGNSFVSHAQFVLNIVKQMKLFSTVEEVKLTHPEDQKIQSKLADILDRWQKETMIYQASTTRLLNKLTSFQNTLVNVLQPSANNMYVLLSDVDLAEEAKQLKQEIDTLQAQINAKQKEYDMDCGLANTGAAGIVLGPLVIVTWAVTGGIYGAKAEKVRKERNQLQSTLDGKKALYDNLNKVSGNVHRATDGIADLKIAITNAITGLKTLNAVWDLLSQYISSAKDSLIHVNEKTELFDFIYEIENAQSSWKEVPSIAAGLLDLFKQADASFQLNMHFNMLSLQEELSTNSPYKFDIDIWNDSYAALNNVIIKPESTFMPTLQKKANELRNDAREIYDTTIQTLPIAVSVSGKNPMINSNPSLFNTYVEKMKADPSDTISATYFNKLVERLKKEANTFDNKLEVIENTIRNNTKILKRNTRTDLTSTGFYALLNSECKRFDKVIQSHTQMLLENFIEPMLALQAEMKKLDNEIEEKLDPENIIKTFKEFLPSEEEISSMITEGTKSPETSAIEGIKLVYSTALKAFDVFASTLKLCEQVEEQVKLSNELEDLHNKYEEVNKNQHQMLQNQMELNYLLKLHNILTFFADAGASEAKNISEMRTKLLGYIGAVPVDYSNYNKSIIEFRDCMEQRYNQ